MGGHIYGHIDKDGYIVRYDAEHNDFAKAHIKKGISTMYKPVDGKAYYDGIREGDLERGGRA